MNQHTMYMRNACKKMMVLALVFAGLVTFGQRAQAQTTTTLIPSFTNVWKYDASGANLGTLWRTNAPAFNDSAWASGSGLLGAEDGIAPYLIHAPSGILTPLPISNTITTYYFRTTFNLPISPTTPGLVLVSSNLVDDGCLIWLNGRLAGALRLSPTATSTTLATAGTEGALEVLTLTNFLRAGVNTIAVEVHQASVGSSDVVFGMKLVAIVPTTLTITNQPDSVTAEVGDSVTFTVGVSGGPVSYRWQKDGVPLALPNAGNSSYTISGVQLANAGAYRVVVSNAVNVVTSDVAQLTVFADTTGPKLVSAVINDGFGSNRVNIRFDEAIITSVPPTAKNSPRNAANYRLVSTTNSNFAYTITNISAGGFNALLSIGDATWDPLGSYYLIVNNVADTRGNSINPNSVIGVSVQIFTNLTQMRDSWSYYDCASVVLCDENSDAVYANEAFSKTNYVQDPFTWGTGIGIFVKESGLGEIQPCAGDVKGSDLSFQMEPTLFRRTFTLPSNASSNGNLRLRFIFDDGMLVYLNGRPLYSNNVVGPISKASRATAQVTEAACNTNVTLNVSNLRPGTNWLVAAVVQHQANPESDTVFGLEMDLVTLRNTQGPTNRPPGTPTITRTRQADKFVLSWPATNYGYALMYSTDIVGTGARPDRNWYTNNANWLQVQDQSNPYTNAIPPTTGPRRFYKLFREKLND